MNESFVLGVVVDVDKYVYLYIIFRCLFVEVIDSLFIVLY